MRKLVNALEDALKAGKPAVLCSIVASSGSTPRGEGAMMIVTEDGRIAGTIGGGAVEYNSEKIAAEVLKEKKSRQHPFVLQKNDVEDIGMICGGNVQVEFFYIDPLMPESLYKLEELKTVVRRLSRVYIFGGGHVAQALVPVLTSIDFECVVLEDREDYCSIDLFPGAVGTILCDNQNIKKYVSITADDYVCIMTRGHKDDMIIESQVLKTPAKYIGVIGSRHKIAGVNAQLKERGCTDEEIARITTPIGMPIKGANTPQEIAISIAAQLIEVRAEGMAK